MVRIHEGPPTISLTEHSCPASSPFPMATPPSRLTSSSRTPPGISMSSRMPSGPSSACGLSCRDRDQWRGPHACQCRPARLPFQRHQDSSLRGGCRPRRSHCQSMRQPVGRRQPRRHGRDVAAHACHGASIVGPLSTVDRVHSGSVRISEVLPSAQAGGEAPSRVFEQRGRSFFSSLRLNGQEIRQIAGPSSGPARRLNLGSLRRRGLPRWTWMPSGKGLGERSFRPPG